VDLNGEPTERYHEAARVNQVVQAQESLFVDAQPVRAQIGILVDQQNAIVCHGMGAVERLLDAVKGAYQACWSAGYPVEFITPDLLAAGKGKDCRLLLMPFLMLVTPACAKAVAQFVEQGGVAVAFAKCGMLNEKSWYWHDRPGGLTGLFGVKESRIAKSDTVILRPEDGASVFDGVAGPLEGHWHREDFVLQDDVDVLARYEDGAPAVTGHSYGKGYAILFGTHFDVAALGEGALAHRRVFANLARMSGVERPFVLEGDGMLDGHLLRPTHHDDDAPWGLFILLNHFADARSTLVRLPGAPANAAVTDLFTGARIHATPSTEGLSFEASLDGYGSTAFLIG
jgi:beta-galactosidase